MTDLEFVSRMKYILEKMGDASGMCFTWHLVSADPDCISDFGCDHEGNLVIDGEAFPPLKIADMTNIRYRWNDEEYSDCFVRFEFGKDIYLDCYISDDDWAQQFCVKYNDTDEFCNSKDKAKNLLASLITEPTESSAV